MDEIKNLKRKLAKERTARKRVENILADKELLISQKNGKLIKIQNLQEKKNQQLTSKIKLADDLSKFPKENPSPVLRFSFPELKVLYTNNSGQEILNFLNKSKTRKSRFFTTLKKAYANDTPCSIELGVTDKTFICNAVPIKSANYLNTYFSDITELKRTQLFLLDSQTELTNTFGKLEKSEEKYRSLVENASDLIYSCSFDGKIIYINPKVTMFLKYKEKELLGTSFLKLVAKKYLKQVSNFYKFQLKEKLQSTYIEFPIIDKSGKEIWIGQSADLLFNDGVDTFNLLARDISDRKRVEKALMMSQEKYRGIIENMGLGLCEVDRNGIILKPNLKFCKLTGFTNDELVGKDGTTFLLSRDEQLKMRTRLKERIKGGSEVYEVKIKRKDGSDIWVLTSGAPHFDETGKVSGSIGIHLDISFQKKLEDELRSSKIVAEESVQAKDLFLANITHELRTPLNAIMGISELVLNGKLVPEQRKHLETILNSGDNLLRLINDILDLSKITSGKLTLLKKPTNLAQTIDDVIRSFKVIAAKKNLSFKLQSEIDPDQNYEIDATRLKEVFFNLIGNAIKFTERGSVSLIIKRQLSANDYDIFSFEVIDTGMGIPKEDMQAIFKIFEQASNANLSLHGGTGLGLSISQGIIDSMSSKLMVSSKIGIGSKFYFSIKFMRTSESIAVKKTHKQMVENVFSDNHILIVEDAEINRFLAIKILEHWGCQVTSVKNGLEAVNIVETNNFDLILMDIRMPIMSGLEACEIIRKTYSKDQLPIIALTANAISGESDKCFEKGMNAYLSKPYAQIELFQILKEFLEINNDLTALAKSKINMDGINSITDGDAVFRDHMIKLFIAETTKRIEMFKEHLENEDEAAIIKTAHTIKPGIAHICHESIFDLVKDIEMGEYAVRERIELVKKLISLLEQSIRDLKFIFSN